MLVGEFPTIDDPEAQRELQTIKTLNPQTLPIANSSSTAQSLATVRQFQRNLKQRLGKSVPSGPMGHAFLTRNPLLPKEYFAPKGVEEEVAKWNEDLEHSLFRHAQASTPLKSLPFAGEDDAQGR